MKKTKFLKQLTAFVVTLSVVLPFGSGNLQCVSAAENSNTRSLTYVENMGKGWNLSNTYDSNRSDDFSKSDETSWGMPPVTQDLIKAIKSKGYSSLRIPMTAYTRYSLVDGHYVINEAWMKKYKQTVDWAVAEGLYVMINTHHDAGWLSKWDGNKSSVEYKTYVDLWTQIADTFKDEPDTVCFETINEPYFESDTGNITKQDKLDMINLAGHDVVRKSGGNNATRMMVIPTMGCNSADGNSDKTSKFIASLNDPNIMATVHYYSDWVYSGSLGITGFDEKLYPDNDKSEETPRKNVDLFYKTLSDSFTSKGIGVAIGEYGLLGQDFGPSAHQEGEKLKYFEYMNYAAPKGICPMVWQNIINRTAPFSYDPPLLGAMVDACIRGGRSSFSTGLNEIYLTKAVDNGLQIPLTLNGNKFLGIDGLTNGQDYTYDEATATVTLSKDFVNSKFNALAANQYGNIADLVMKFSAGADWHQYLIKYAAAVLNPATGTTTSVDIPVNFNGSKLRRAAAYDASGKRVGTSAWFTYESWDSGFKADYDKSTITIPDSFFKNDTVKDGTIKFTFEFYDGQKINYTIEKSGTNVTGKQS